MQRLSLAVLLVLSSCAEKVARPAAIDEGAQGGGGSGTPAPADAGGRDSGDSGAQATVLASGLDAPRAIAVGGSALYFALAGATDGGVLGSIARVSKQGGAVVTLVPDVDAPVAIAASPAAVCFLSRPAVGLGSVYCAPLPSGPVVTIATGEEGLSAIAIDGSYVYWTSALAGTLVERSLVTGGGVAVVATAPGACAPAGLAVDSGFVYFACSGAAANVYAAPVAGGTALPLDLPALATCGDVVSEGSRVLVAREAPSPAGSIVSVPKIGGASTLFASKLGAPGHMARDGAFVYWTSPTDGVVYARATATPAAPPLAIASGLTAPLGIAVDDAVYFTTASAVQRASLAQ
jgi:hypothetical protein